MEIYMKVVIAIDSFKGSMTSMEAGNAAKKGILAAKPDAEVWLSHSQKAVKEPRMH